VVQAIAKQKRTPYAHQRRQDEILQQTNKTRFRD